MLIYEFVERTGYFPKSMDEWNKIEKEYMADPDIHKDDFCPKWAEQHSKKVKKQHYDTDFFIKDLIKGSGTYEERCRSFEYWINRTLKIRRDIRGKYCLATAFLHFMERKSLGYALN